MYVKTNWVDNTTPIDSTNLNKIEQGIYNNSLVTDAVNNTVKPSESALTNATEITEGQMTNVIGIADIKIKGQIEQDGTPTPSAPVDINVVSGSNVINTSNKNLFDVNKILQGDWNIPNLSTSLVLYLGKISEGDKFTASNYNSRKFAFIISSMPIQSNQASALQSSGNQTATRSTFTATANGYLFFKITKTDGGDITPNEINSDDFQIEKDETATSYVEHQGKKLTLNLGTIELCKIGNYQDYFYKSESKWYLHKEVEKIVLNGTENWIDSISQSGGVALAGLLSSSPNIALSNILKYQSGSTAWTEDGKFGFNSSGVLWCKISNTINSLNDWKAYLNSNNMIIYYYKYPHTDTEIIDTTLINQLEAIYNAPLYEQTNITQTNNDLPMVLDITACKDNINGIKAWIRR